MKMKNKFEDVIAKNTNEKLVEIVSSPKGDYQEEAVEQAWLEIRKRVVNNGDSKELPNEQILEILKKIIKNETSVSNEAPKHKGVKIQYETSTQSNASESALRTIATLVMVCGVIITVTVLIFGIMLISDYDTITGFTAILSAIAILVSTLVIWALLRVFCNISLNIKDIKETLNDK